VLPMWFLRSRCERNGLIKEMRIPRRICSRRRIVLKRDVSERMFEPTIAHETIVDRNEVDDLSC